jgi:hypothetical protein
MDVMLEILLGLLSNVRKIVYDCSFSYLQLDCLLFDSLLDP